MYSDDLPHMVYDIGGRRWVKGAPGFAEAIAAAFAQQRRPRCLCQQVETGKGIEMYVARLIDGYIVKRMPNTGSQHATSCLSYEPPAELSGLEGLLGSAISENTATGKTTLKLDFPLTKILGRSRLPSANRHSGSVATEGTKLSLTGLLHYLWDQAELTRWRPSFKSKRSWATVRKHLLQAAQHKIASGSELQNVIYIPEVFYVEQRDAINARRLVHWGQALPTQGQKQQLILLIGEVKAIERARYGYKVVVKHVPDQAFAIDECLYRKLGRCFERELALWGASEVTHMVMISTFSVSAGGMPSIQELSLMPATAQWIPVESAFELQLIDTLVKEGRAFTRGLRYGTFPLQALASAILTDTSASPCPLYVLSQPGSEDDKPQMLPTSPSPWVWHTSYGGMPQLPAKQRPFSSFKEVAQV